MIGLNKLRTFICLTVFKKFIPGFLLFIDIRSLGSRFINHAIQFYILHLFAEPNFLQHPNLRTFIHIHSQTSLQKVCIMGNYDEIVWRHDINILLFNINIKGMKILMYVYITNTSHCLPHVKTRRYFQLINQSSLLSKLVSIIHQSID